MNIYTNDQVAQQLGVAVGTIRSWKSRRSSELIPNQHWFVDNGTTYWTEEGISALQTISTTVKVKPKPTATPTATSATESVAATNPIERYRPLIKQLATLLTPQLLQELDREVTQQVGMALANPMTETECITLLSELGLAPASPTALINGNNVAGYLEGETDE